ncbi:unnamed protein product [Rotaria magnacalcarata]|uniref:Uncharacterized protein n=2 Tax=Rotaria magnacalcarata TaxID=392030 RepID=A0A816Z6W5_9BILA|nr:unnamed protein product [Rotaria magnacalcarata]CAF2028137.1 unnamed protein product [Rotaria magnacalcarata]CAF2074322.1 unnamed protein product [Rotaria magnacalcarata]CAF2180160.1 unnamed protein product [Rotaria magnacalcarata]CAF4211659.1 unnamed protein product [Rotaria magnacalcarata]
MDIFNPKLQTYINTLSENRRIKYTIKNDMYSNIVNVLKSKDMSVSPRFKFWVKETLHLIHIGSSELVYVKKKNLPLITRANIFAKIAECHSAVGYNENNSN